MNAQELQTIYNYSKNLFDEVKDVAHDFSHIQRVLQNALKIIQLLNLSEEIDINIVQATCLLHDITFVYNKPSLKTWMYEGKIAANILEELEIFNNAKEKTLIINAVRHHGHSFPIRKLNKKRDLYCRILQDADTLDLFSEERLERLNRSKNKYIFHDITSVLGRPILNFSRKNIAFFLNFPKLAPNFSEKIEIRSEVN